MSLDLRTRVDGTDEPVAPADFFERRLPAALQRHRALLAPCLAHRPPSPLTIRVGSHDWTLHAAAGSIAIREGGTAGTPQLHLQPAQLADLVNDQVTPNGWLTRGSLRSNAPFADLLDWWLLLRGALDGVAPYVPGSLSLTDAQGAPLQLTRRFALDDSPRDMRHFLHQAGFLRLRNVFSPAEMAAISSDMDRLATRYTRSDARSFWGRTASGEERLVRMQHFDAQSSRAAALAGDERIRFIVGLTGDGHEANREAGLVEALFKPAGMADLLADFPWHKDCSLGRHSYECCSLTACVSVTRADRVRGRLRMVAGSHRALMWPVLRQPDVDLPVVDLPANTGDVSLHLSCTMHMSQPPVRGERRVLYVGFRLPERDAGAAANARLRSGLRTVDLARDR